MCKTQSVPSKGRGIKGLSRTAMRIEILSLFPRYFQGPFDESMIGRARRKGLLDIHLVDIRAYSEDKHQSVDDRAYGGGPGMVLRAEPVAKAIRESKRQGEGKRNRVVYLSPQGPRLTAKKCRELAEYEHLILLAGHYEGVDERVLSLVDESVSIGDYVLTNGCLPAIVLVDAVTRLLPGVIGHEDAARQDSFEEDLFDCAHYTRPEVWEGQRVPEVLLSGDHAAIARWRKKKAIEKTAEVRPDLLFRYLERVEGEQGSQQREGQLCKERPPKKVILFVQNLRASRLFYKDQLGLKLVAAGEESLLFALGNQELLLLPGEKQEAHFVVEGVDAAMMKKLARSASEQEVGASADGPKLNKVWLRDPDGYQWVCESVKSLD